MKFTSIFKQLAVSSAKMLQFQLLVFLFYIADLAPVPMSVDVAPITSNATALLKDGLSQVVSSKYMLFFTIVCCCTGHFKTGGFAFLIVFIAFAAAAVV